MIPRTDSHASAFTAKAQGFAADVLRYHIGPPNEPHWVGGTPRNSGVPSPLASTTRPHSTTFPSAPTTKPVAKPISGCAVTQPTSAASHPSRSTATRPETNTIAPPSVGQALTADLRSRATSPGRLSTTAMSMPDMLPSSTANSAISFSRRSGGERTVSRRRSGSGAVPGGTSTGRVESAEAMSRTSTPSSAEPCAVPSMITWTGASAGIRKRT